MNGTIEPDALQMHFYMNMFNAVSVNNCIVINLSTFFYRFTNERKKKIEKFAETQGIKQIKYEHCPAQNDQNTLLHLY